jgi:predicted XRE-type DNA-binding protein
LGHPRLSEEIEVRDQNAANGGRSYPGTTQATEGGFEMKNDDMELVRGSGNVYRDFGHPNAGLEQARAIIAAKIINILDERKFSTRDAEKLTGVSHSEFTRIRNTQLRRFTLDRMIGILGKLDEDIEVNVTFRPRRHGAQVAPNVR